MSSKKNVNIDWELDLEIYDVISLELLVEILQLGERRFHSTLNDYNDLKRRCFTLLAIILSICGALIPIIITKEFFGSKINDDCLGLLMLLCLLASLYAIWNFAVILFPRKLKITGEEPKDIFYESLVEVNKNDQKLHFLINRIEVVQDKISFNEHILQDCIKLFERALISVGLAYMITLGYSIIKYLM